jgi:hypothetical protein
VVNTATEAEKIRGIHRYHPQLIYSSFAVKTGFLNVGIAQTAQDAPGQVLKSEYNSATWSRYKIPVDEIER